MRSAGNFHPEWGYLAPAPSFMRTARIVVVATAIGATAGAAAVLSLVDRPTTDTGTTSIAAHALVTSVQATTSAAAATPRRAAPIMTAAPVTPLHSEQPKVSAATPAQALPSQALSQAKTAASSSALAASSGPASSDTGTASPTPPPSSPSSVAALADQPPANEAAAPAPETTTALPDAATADKKPAKKHRAVYGPWRSDHRRFGGVPPMFRRMF